MELRPNPKCPICKNSISVGYYSSNAFYCKKHRIVIDINGKKIGIVKMIRTNVTFTPEDMKFLKYLAYATNKNRSWIIRQMIKDFREKLEEDKNYLGIPKGGKNG